jgi:hypothetical protein
MFLCHLMLSNQEVAMGDRQKWAAKYRSGGVLNYPGMWAHSGCQI